MYKKSYLWIVAVAIVLAGCTGSIDVVDQRSDGGDGSSNAGDGGSGDVALVENRTAALRAAGSYTSVWKMSVTRDGERGGETRYTTAVDYAGKRSDFRMRQSDGDTVRTDYETYFADGMGYQRIGSGEEATYSVAETPFSPDTTLFNAEPKIYTYGGLDEFETAGTETFDGVTVTRYERTQRPAWLAGQFQSEDDVRWTKFTFAVLVDGDGLVRSESWHAEGVDADDATVEMDFSYSLTGVGSTTVEEPDWADAARENAAAQ
ncbi:MAG: hypothetical protein ABEJ26_10830 [Halosimplex sp.]